MSASSSSHAPPPAAGRGVLSTLPRSLLLLDPHRSLFRYPSPHLLSIISSERNLPKSLMGEERKERKEERKKEKERDGKKREKERGGRMGMGIGMAKTKEQGR